MKKIRRRGHGRGGADFTGVRFGRLVGVRESYVSFDAKGHIRHRFWEWECDCGHTTKTHASAAKWNAERGWGCCPNCIWTIRAAGEPPAHLVGLV